MRTQTKLHYSDESEAHASLYFGVRIDSSLFVTLRLPAEPARKQAASNAIKGDDDEQHQSR
jgi:hypothetical protein